MDSGGDSEMSIDTRDSKICSIYMLPAEILFQVFGFLEARDLCACAQVCVQVY